MVLDDAQRQQVQEWLVAHSADHRIPDCSFCGGSGRWEYSLYTPVVVGRETKFGMQPRRTTVELACQDCGHLLTFNGILIGLIDPFFQDQPEEPPTSPE